MAVPPRVVIADRGDAGRRMDLVVCRHLVDLPCATRSKIQAWIVDGRVSVNGRVVRRGSDRATRGDTLEIAIPDDSARAPVTPEQRQLDWLYEDEQLAVVNKPAGIVAHPTFRHPSGSLLNFVLWHARSWSDGTRPSLVGRLDKLTSGAIVIAKTTEAHARLQRVLASSRSEKLYVAVVHGPVRDERGIIDLPLQRDPTDRRRVVVATGEGLRSATRFERLDQADSGERSIALLRCQLVTGRMHQVRVHLAARGWPIVGDPKYRPAALVETLQRSVASGAPPEVTSGFPRQALHAWRVSFTHPFTGQAVHVEAPLPDDLRTLLAACRLGLP